MRALPGERGGSRPTEHLGHRGGCTQADLEQHLQFCMAQLAGGGLDAVTVIQTVQVAVGGPAGLAAEERGPGARQGRWIGLRGGVQSGDVGHRAG